MPTTSTNNVVHTHITVLSLPSSGESMRGVAPFLILLSHKFILISFIVIHSSLYLISLVTTFYTSTV